MPALTTCLALLPGLLLSIPGDDPMKTALELTVREEAAGRIVPARVRVRDASGLDHVPEGGYVVKIGPSDRWFVSEGKTQIPILAGRIEIRVERGLEYAPIKQTIDVPAGVSHPVEIKLHRWINMRDRGYVSGEDHVHLPPGEAAAEAAAEGVDFGSSLQWWNNPKYDVPAATGFVQIQEFAGVKIPVSVYDFEVEHSWGAVYGLGLPEPLEYDSAKNRFNLPLARLAHDRGALICYQGGWTREVLVDALLGCVDVVNLNDNNFHRHAFQPRSRNSNLLEVEGFPVYPDTPEGMMQQCTETYYRLINCGLRLAAGAGTAANYKPNPIGYNRTYVRAGKNPTLPDFLKAWRAGRNFVTNGPMLFLTIDDRHEPGDTIALPRPGGDVNITVQAFSDQPLTSLEILINGELAAADAKVSGSTGVLMHKCRIEEGAWIAARCTAKDELLSDKELNVYSIDGGTSTRPSRHRFAHTSPVYVTVGGKGPHVARSIEEARKMLAAFEKYAATITPEEKLSEVRKAVKDARKRLDEM